MRVAIVGSRTFNNYNLLEKTICNKMVGSINLIVSGGAKGADSLAEKFAKKHNISMRIFSAEWDKYGRGAGYIRNKLIIDNADVVFAFWDGKVRVQNIVLI